MSNQLDFVENCPYRGNNEQYCPYYGKTCECDEDEQEVCDLFSKYKDNMKKLLDTRAIKPEKYDELREQDFDTWLETILHEIIEQINFDADEVDKLGSAVWNGECPDGTPYPKVCAREDAYIQCIRQSNQLDILRHNIDTSLNEINERLCKLEHIIDHFVLPDFRHIGSDFCGNCIHHQMEEDIPTCSLTGELCDHDDASCAMYQDSYIDTDSATKEVRNSAKAKLNSMYGKKVSNQLDKLSGKPDREECKHCPKSQCDNCMNFPF